MPRYPTTWFVSVAAVALALAAAVWWVGTLDRSTAGLPATSGFPAAAPARSGPAVDVLRRWDLARARAYATGDVAGLRALYVHGSSAGTADARMLRAYQRRGLRVEGIRMQVLEVVVLAHAPGRWRLRVTDRLTGAVAIGDPRSGAAGEPVRLRLPRDEASTRVVTLRLRDGSWRVATVR